VQRWLKLAAYLQKSGVAVSVITPQNPVASNFDESLLQEVPSEIEVHHTYARDPFSWYQKISGKKKINTGGIGLSKKKKSLGEKLVHYIRANFFIPDARKGWNSFAYAKALELFKHQPFDALITSGPPHSTHLVGLRLQQKFKSIWLADFRDPWVNIFYNALFPRTTATVKKDQALENKVLAAADCVLTVSPGLTTEFKNRAKRIETLYNGYDADDIPDADQQPQTHFCLRYTGNFKPNQNVPALWQALANLRAEQAQFKADFKLDLVGNVDENVAQSIAANGLSECTNFLGYQPHQVATQYMVNASALLFIVPQTAENQLILTGKLFEYLGSGTPLLAIAPPTGNAAKIIVETERGEALDYEDVTAIKERILDLYNTWLGQNKQRQHLAAEPTLKYTRAGAAQQLLELMNELKA
jgi:glycosyltransferase involved in cell wall biosynthesis